MSSAESDDATLVIASLNGEREAFGQIVSRYQALVASVAYSGTGNLAQSEDLAQETFVAAVSPRAFVHSGGLGRFTGASHEHWHRLG